MAAPQVSLEAWREFAKSLVSLSAAPDRGILVVEDERGYILGLVGYVIDCDLEHGQTLIPKNLIAIETLEANRKEVAFALIWSLQDLARVERCRAIRTIIHEPEASLRDVWIMEVLKGACYHAESRRFFKVVESTG